MKKINRLPEPVDAERKARQQESATAPITVGIVTLNELRMYCADRRIVEHVGIVGKGDLSSMAAPNSCLGNRIRLDEVIATPISGSSHRISAIGQRP
jgi:hypothetical protein